LLEATGGAKGKGFALEFLHRRALPLQLLRNSFALLMDGLGLLFDVIRTAAVRPAERDVVDERGKDDGRSVRCGHGQEERRVVGDVCITRDLAAVAEEIVQRKAWTGMSTHILRTKNAFASGRR
jgi:hypothetical protein